MKKKDMVDMLIIRVPLYSHSIDIVRAETVFLEDGKKKISISHILEGN